MTASGLARKSSAALALALLTGCGSLVGTGTVDLRCAGWRPISIGNDDVLTDQTAREIEGHNLYGEALKCW